MDLILPLAAGFHRRDDAEEIRVVLNARQPGVLAEPVYALVAVPDSQPDQFDSLRGIAEHGMTTGGNEMTDSRTVATNPVLSFLICNINYHIEHHLYPGVPWYNLPKVHNLLQDEYRAAGSSVYTSYTDFLGDVVRAIVQGVRSNRRLVPDHIREYVCV